MKEYREIIFTRTEVIQALYDYAYQRTPAFPPGRAHNLHVQRDEGVSAAIMFGEKKTAFEAHEITAALIRYAKKVHVPLPRQSTKSLGIVEEGLVLKLRID